MKYFFLITFTILFTLLSNSCSDKKDKLIVDEIFISKHSLAPPYLRKVMKFIPPGSRPTETNYEETDTLFEFCYKNNLISNYSYLPKLIVKIDIGGTLIGYIKNCDKLKEGYLQFIMPDSLLVYINRQIEKMNYTKLDTLYSDEGEYIGHSYEYFLSIKKDGNEKQVMIMHDYKGPSNIIRFIDSLYNYMDRKELSLSLNTSFRRDTLIVLKSEKYFEQSHKKILRVE
jgi:hypothetical protein